jgi:hypothetical protein
MAEYLTEAAYMRWYRQYIVNLGLFVDQFDLLRIRVDALFAENDVEAIANLSNEIDSKFQEALPRNYSNGTPLMGAEKFSENIKVLINLIRKLFRKPIHFLGAYQAEKDRVLKIQSDYKFNEKLKLLDELIEMVEAKQIDEINVNRMGEHRAVEQVR